MKQYSYEEIYAKLKIAAQVVSIYGDIYLPIFERVQEELEKSAKRKKMLDLATQVALE